MASEAHRPKAIGQYQVIRELARGGMATVYIARATGAAGFERLVVVKRMHAYLVSDPEANHRFVTEARVAARLHHANVVGVQHVGTDEDGYFLVYDYIEGDALSGLVERLGKIERRMEPAIVARCVLDALAGLHAAHEMLDDEGKPLEVLHRDVTPQNLMVGCDGVTRLTDFGVAKVKVADFATQEGRLVGKVMFLAPEYLKREQADRRLDVYAMGLTAWMSFSGQRPWDATSEGRLIYRIVSDGVPPLGKAVPELPVALQDAVMRACAANADERYPTAAAMADALERAARSTCGVATHAEVAALMTELMGEEIAERRKSLGLLAAAIPVEEPPEESLSLSGEPVTLEIGGDATAEAPPPAEPPELTDEQRMMMTRLIPRRVRSRNARYVGLAITMLALGMGVAAFAKSRGGHDSGPAAPPTVDSVAKAATAPPRDDAPPPDSSADDDASDGPAAADAPGETPTPGSHGGRRRKPKAATTAATAGLVPLKGPNPNAPDTVKLGNPYK